MISFQNQWLSAHHVLFFSNEFLPFILPFCFSHPCGTKGWKRKRWNTWRNGMFTYPNLHRQAEPTCIYGGWNGLDVGWWERHQNSRTAKELGQGDDAPLSHRKWARPQKEIHLPGTSYHWFSGTIWQTVSFREGICFGDDNISFFWDSFWHAEFCRFQTLILHWSLQIPDFFCEIFRPKKCHLNGPEKPEKMILICWIAVELDDHRCIQRQILEEITSSAQLSTYLILSITATRWHQALKNFHQRWLLENRPYQVTATGMVRMGPMKPTGMEVWIRWEIMGSFGMMWWWMMGSTDQVAWQLPHAPKTLE